jgi:Sortase domain
MPDNARSSAPFRWARALFALAGVTALAGIVGLIVTTRGEATGTEPVTSFVVTTPTPPPSTAGGPTAVPPTASPDSTMTTIPASESTTPPTPPVSTSVPLSPLADLLGDRGSVIPEPIVPRVVPTRLMIDDLYIDVPVRPVGLEEDGQLEIPDETEVGWYRYGSVPGRPGATVMAGHVTWNRTNGPFWLLRDLEPGSLIDVELEDGSVRTYEAVERAIYGKSELPRNRIWRTTGDETLVLITCGGDYNPDIRRYLENVVIYAVPVATDGSADPASGAEG